MWNNIKNKLNGEDINNNRNTTNDKLKYIKTLARNVNNRKNITELLNKYKETYSKTQKIGFSFIFNKHLYSLLGIIFWFFNKCTWLCFKKIS